jgi:hypothetical protein
MRKVSVGKKVSANKSLKPIPRSKPKKPVMTVDEAVAADRRYFDEHPDEEEYIREFVPGEFGAAELPEILPGFRYPTCVSVMLRVDGEPVGRYRNLMMVSEGEELQRLVS